MSRTFAKNITADDLRGLLRMLPLFESTPNELSKQYQELKPYLIDAAPLSWCHFYELPIHEHLDIAMAGILNLVAGKIDTLPLESAFANQSDIGRLPSTISELEEHFANASSSTDEDDQTLAYIPAVLGASMSAYKTLSCVLYHGCYLNTLIAQARRGNDAAIFKAIKMDASVLGCPTVAERISEAVMLEDQGFLDKLKRAINGKQTKRAQANFQRMRLVLKVLGEACATRLSDEALHELFVKELNLYDANEMEGGCEKSLRKFADTYMSQNATTQNR